MKLNRNFITHTIDGETVLVPTADADFHGLVQGNKSVGFILECLEKDTTEEKITDALSERFSGDREIMRTDVADVISKLREIGAIDE